MNDLSEQIVDRMNTIYGAHPGTRAVHAKGICCKGTFTATPRAANHCIAAHLQGNEIPVTVRFSNGTGKPTRADGAQDERGMAVKFHLPDGSSTDIVSLTLPVFFVKTAADFFEFLELSLPDPATGKPDLEKVKAFVDAHPESQMAIGFRMFSEAPASYADCTFHGIHAFEMTAPDGAKRWVRYRWEPNAGGATLTDEETRALGKDYLRDEIERRLKASPVEFDLWLQIATDDDDPDDPTTPWPEEREQIKAGQLRLTEFADQECAPMIFDPGRLTDGIERSNDEILHARSGAYSVSFDRRNAT